MHNSYSYKQKETSPNRVTNGRVDILESSHFSSNLLTLQANIIVYKKIRMFKPTPTIPRYKGNLHGNFLKD
jgi:hypothetical protein